VAQEETATLALVPPATTKHGPPRDRCFAAMTGYGVQRGGALCVSTNPHEWGTKGVDQMQNQDVLKIIDGLCNKLQEAEFEGHGEEKDLIADVGEVVKSSSARSWVNSAPSGFAEKTKARSSRCGPMGGFWPDIAVEVRGLPTVAITVRQARRDDDLAVVLPTHCSSVIHSVQYSYAIPLFSTGRTAIRGSIGFDSEIEERLWLTTASAWCQAVGGSDTRETPQGGSMSSKEV